jgi:phage tail tape-measure protein
MMLYDAPHYVQEMEADASLKKVAMTVGGVFTIGKALEFGKVMMDGRGQIESFQISFEALIGSSDKANAFFSEIKNFATETPLMLDDLARNAQTFLGLGIETEKGNSYPETNRRRNNGQQRVV